MLVCAALCAVGCSRTRGVDPFASTRSPGDDGDVLEDGGRWDPRDPVCIERCDDGAWCNGLEDCDLATLVCMDGEPPDCDDDDECTLDLCDESQRGCVHERAPRDEDDDGHDACDADCDDDDPTIHPGADEQCDGVDEDCDGQVDEGLRSECGDCRPGCELRYLPPPGTPWTPTADNSDAVTPEDDGAALVLTSETRRRFDAWIANYVDGKVTKLDTRDGTQVAMYDSVLSGPGNGAEPPDRRCDRDGLNPEGGGNCPSRTAVDLQGAVYVANRAFGSQGTVTKIAGFPDDCVDRNGDGEIQTSRDVDGNGLVERFVGGEFLGQDDECLLWTVDVGGVDGVPRALAVAADGGVWVGLHGEGRVLELDPSDGSVRRSVTLGAFSPYGAAIDSRGRLWVVESLTGQIVDVDTETGRAGRARTAPSPRQGCPSSYGIAIDPDDRVWFAGFTCPYAFGYDPDAGSWSQVALPEAGVTRGIAADDRGRIFVAASHDWLRINTDSVFGYLETSAPISRLTVFDAASGDDVRTFGTNDEPLPGEGAIGVGLDLDGRAWLVNRESSSATRVDVDTGDVAHFGAGDLPYTYSDFTGFALRRITAPSGFVRGLVQGCAMGPSEWETLWVDAQVPSDGRVQIRLRAADTRDALTSARWLGPWDASPIDLLSVPELGEGRYLEVEARLVSGDRRRSPTLRQVTVQLHCPI
jgi:streptogramin lyase